MGTNYYAMIDACPHCGRADNDIHLGKSSGGWRFAVAVKPHKNDRHYNTWLEFKEFVTRKDVTIKDEYGDPIHSTELLKMIAVKQTGETSMKGDLGTRKDGPVDMCYYEFS